MTKTMTLASLFDGIGGFPYAASFYGIRPLWASEIVPECVAVTRRHFPDMAHLGDVTQLHGGTVPPVDILTFGSPCQGLSLAGCRLGLADERSGLFMEAIRIIREMQEATHGRYPQFAIFENVPYVLQCIRNIMDRNQLCTSPPKNSGTRQFSPVPLCIIVVVSV